MAILPSAPAADRYNRYLDGRVQRDVGWFAASRSPAVAQLVRQLRVFPTASYIHAPLARYDAAARMDQRCSHYGALWRASLPSLSPKPSSFGKHGGSFYPRSLDIYKCRSQNNFCSQWCPPKQRESWREQQTACVLAVCPDAIIAGCATHTNTI